MELSLKYAEISCDEGWERAIREGWVEGWLMETVLIDWVKELCVNGAEKR